MGGLLHIFEFNKGAMAKKVQTHDKGHDGLEAPRNSLELQVESLQSHSPMGDLPCCFQVEEDCSRKHCNSNEASMKKLINEEVSRRSNTRQNSLSIVARLMGMDQMPSDTKPVNKSTKNKNENIGNKFPETERNGRGSPVQESYKSYSSRSSALDSFYHYEDRDDDRWNRSQQVGKPRPLEHPQEEELQKFKKEFIAWQTARFKECSKAAEVGSISGRLLAQENLNKEKRAMHADAGRFASDKTRTRDRGGLEHHEEAMYIFPAKQKEYFSTRSRTLSRDFEESLLMKSNKRLDQFSPPRIVILKPGPNRFGIPEESWISPSRTLEEKSSMKDFLEEVKLRLKCELQGKAFKKGSVIRGSGIETPYKERPSDPKQIYQQMAKRLRESVTKDIGINLVRSELTRSCESESPFNGPGSSQFINRDTRRFLSERLGNILKSEIQPDASELSCGSSGPSMLDNERSKHKQVADILKSENDMRFWEFSKDEKEMLTGSFRHEFDDNMLHKKQLSPRNLVRSLSAPVSGTSFGKLLLEDRHIFTGAHIRRKHEAVETVCIDVKKQKKDRFSFKEKVSSFKYSLTLRGRLFGKWTQSRVEPPSNGYIPVVRDLRSGPTVLMSFGERNENSTELPPSPASICSSPQEEFWRPDYISPISTPDLPSRDENIMPGVFKEISSNLNELRRRLNQLECDDTDVPTIEQEPSEPELLEVENQAESYIRDLLVASGLYAGSWDKSLLRADTLAKPISISVFEEVEESYRKLATENGSSLKDQDENEVDHKLLLDLLNEALSTVHERLPRESCFRRNLILSSMLPPPHGRELLNSVWETIRVKLYPSVDNSYYSLDCIVSRDLDSTPWWRMMIDDEINTLVRDIERQAFGDLVEELVKNMRFMWSKASFDKLTSA